MTDAALEEFVTAAAGRYGLPGAAVAVWADGRESYACHGVTSTTNPLPIDRDTLFVLGSVSKTFTATALIRLAADGLVELDAPVRRYLPEFVPADERAAARITVRQLLNHTAGLDWRLAADTGPGDDALAAYVAELAGSRLIAEPGTRASYSQIGFNLLGRIIEKVTGTTFERAVGTLVFEPAGLTGTVYDPAEAMLHRFAVGHNAAGDGGPAVVRRWKDSRANNPGGGAVSSAAELLRWARVHLDDESLRIMQVPTVEVPGSSPADAFGLCWFLRDVDGVRVVGHGGSANGQFAELHLVPERGFAVVALSNAGPDAGLAFNQAAVAWALEHYLNVAERMPDPLPYDADAARRIAGTYENDIMTITIADTGAGLTIDCVIKPEVRAAADTELPPDLPPATLGLLPADGYVVTEGGLGGQRGGLTRNDAGAITGMDLAGRSFRRT